MSVTRYESFNDFYPHYLTAAIVVPVLNGHDSVAGEHTVLNAALSSCVLGLTVGKADNGYEAACAAL